MFYRDRLIEHYCNMYFFIFPMARQTNRDNQYKEKYEMIYKIQSLTSLPPREACPERLVQTVFCDS